MSALVLGGGGFLGLHVVDALRAAGRPHRAGRRKRSNVLPLRSRRTPMVEADLDRPETLVAAMREAEVVVHAAGHYPRLSTDRARTLALGVEQMERALDAAAAAGVRRFIYLSSTATVAPGPGRPAREGDRFPRPPGYGVYHDLKWAMEARAEAESRLEVVTVCPGACLGAWDLRVGTSALLVALARGLDPAHPDGVVNVVDARDVGEAVRRLVEAPDPPRRVLLSGGSHRLHPLLRGLAARYRRPVPSPPLSAEAALRYADAEEARCEAEGGRPRLAREIADLVVHGAPVDGSLARERLGLTYRPLASTLDAFDQWGRRMGLLPPAPPENVMSAHDQRVIQIIATLTTVPAEEIEPQDRLREDLGMDSITSMELISALAEELGLEVEVEEAVVASTVGDVLALAEAHLAGAEVHAAG